MSAIPYIVLGCWCGVILIANEWKTRPECREEE